MITKLGLFYYKNTRQLQKVSGAILNFIVKLSRKQQLSILR